MSSNNNLVEDNEFDLDIRITTAMEASGTDVEGVDTDGRVDAAHNGRVTLACNPDTFRDCGTRRSLCC